MTGRNRGFTLIEILVVITIIAALMGLGFVLLRTATQQKESVITQERIQAIRGALEELKNPHGHDLLVPTDPARLRGPDREKVGAQLGTPNDTNLGIEAVFVALHLKGVDVKMDLDADAFGNTDEDKMSKNPTRLVKNDLMEFVDAWGNPLAYFSGRDLNNWESYKKYMLNSGPAEAKPWRNDATGEFLHKDTFQLFSAGPDGVFNTDDDIKHWR